MIYRINWRKSSSTDFKCTANLAATAPSITRWSYDNDKGTVRRGSNSLPFHFGFMSDLDTPRIATSGALTIGVNAVPPIPPSPQMVNQIPSISAAFNLPSRAFTLICISPSDNSYLPSLSTPRTTGTIRPPGVSTAIPM